MSDRSRDEMSMQTPSDGLSRLAERVSWLALLDDVAADLAVIDHDGRFRYLSPTVRLWRFIAGTSAGAAGPVGKLMHEVFPREMAEERLGFVRRALADAAPLVVIEIWRGMRTRTTFRPMPAEQPGTSLILMVSRVVLDGHDDDEAAAHTHTQAVVNDMGPLSALTPRELDVLALIGRGLSTAQIALALFRSNKTVEAHRLSLGLKLKAANRVQLARIALRAGLTHRKIESGRLRPVVEVPVAPAAALVEDDA